MRLALNVLPGLLSLILQCLSDPTALTAAYSSSHRRLNLLVTRILQSSVKDFKQRQILSQIYNHADHLTQSTPFTFVRQLLRFGEHPVIPTHLQRAPDNPACNIQHLKFFHRHFFLPLSSKQ